METSNILKSNQEIIEKLTRATKVKPIITLRGEDLYTFADATEIAQASILGKKLGAEQDVELGVRELNPSGETYPSSRKGPAAIDPSHFFNNRYRKTIRQPGGKQKVAYYEVVTDFATLQRADAGQPVNDSIPAYVIKVTKGVDDGEETLQYEFTEVKVIDSAEFSKEFKKKLDAKSMSIIKKLTSEAVYSNRISADKLEI